MKLIILLAVAVLSSGAKLDRTYLPPSYAQTSGGNGQILETPITGFGNQHDDFTHATSRGFNQRNGVQNYPQNNNYAQNGNDFALSDKHYAQNGNILAQNDGVSSFDDFDQSRVQAALDRSASILRLDNQNDGEAYSYAYETSNGITAEEGGVARNGVRAQGGYSYTGDDGQVYSVRYTADENGFVPEGDHLPTPPPVPEEILKALEQNAKDEANGIYDDGSYNEGKYEGSQNEQQNNGAGYNYNNGNNFNAGGDFKAVNSVNGARADDDDSIVTTNALLRSNNAAPTRFGQQSGRSNFEDRNGVQKAYLPPFQQKSQFTQSGPNANYDQFQNNGFRNLANTDLKQNGVENAYLPPQPFAPNRRPNARYNSAQNNGFRNKVNSRLSNQNGVEKAYLPPQQYELNAQRTQVNGNARYNPTQNNGFRTQVENFNTQSGIAKTYLPPQQFGQRNQEASRRTNVRNEVEKAYLAPEQFGQRRNQLAAARGTASFRSPVSDGLLRSYLPPSQQATSQIKNKGFQSIGFAKRNGSNREYLPPMDQARNGFVSSAVFDSTHL